MPVHEFKTHNPVPVEEWKEIVQTVNKIIEFSKDKGVLVDGLDGTGTPIVSDEKIEINGYGNGACEPLILLRDFKNSRSIKTRGKPYDLVVASSLLAIDYLTHGRVQLYPGGFKEDWDHIIEFTRKIIPEIEMSEHAISVFNDRLLEDK